MHWQINMAKSSLFAWSFVPHTSGLAHRRWRNRVADKDPPRLVFREQLGGRSPARLSIGLRHTMGAAAKYSQFCLFKRGQLLRVSGDCKDPHAGSHSENLSASRNFDAGGSYAQRGRERNLYILVRSLTWCGAFNAVLTWLRLCGPSIGATTTRVTFGIAQNATPVFRPWSPFLTTPTLSRCAAIIFGFAQQLRQLGDIPRDPPRLIFGEHLGDRSALPNHNAVTHRKVT